MNNKEIRREIFRRNLKKCQVAAALGITPFTFSRWLKYEMNAEKKARVLEAIKSME